MNNKKRQIDPAIKSKVTAFLATQKANNKSTAKKVKQEEKVNSNNSQNSDNLNTLLINNNTQNFHEINNLPLNPHNSLTVIDDNQVTLNKDNPKPDIEVTLNQDNPKNQYNFYVGQQCTYQGQDVVIKEIWGNRAISFKSENLDNPFIKYKFIGEDDDTAIDSEPPFTNESVKKNISTEITGKNNCTNEENNNLTSGKENNMTNSLISNKKTEEIKEAVIDSQGDKIIIDESYQLIENDKDLEKAIALLKDEKVLGIDTETTGLDPHIHKLRLIQIASNNHPTIIIDCYKCNPKLIQPLLINDSIKVFHNAKFDLKFFLALGLEINQSLFDTMLAYQLINAGKSNLKASLKEVTKEYLDIELNKDEQVSQWANKELTESQLRYSAIDAKILLPLREKLREKIVTANLTIVAKIEFDCVLGVAQKEFNGILLDVAKWQGIIEKTQLELNELNSEIQKLLTQENTLFPIDINLNSNQELKLVLNKMGINVKDVKAETLEPFALTNPEIIIPLLKYKKLNHFSNHFGDKLIKKIHPITGRIHTDYKQLGSQAGRFSSQNPNIQQIPKNDQFRSCFVATPNHKLVIADYSQFQIRIGAEISNDETLIEAIKNNTDLHKLTASLVLDKPLEDVTKEDRQLAKAINFGILFGLGADGLRTNLKVSYGIEVSEREAKGFIDKFFANYKGLGKLAKSIKTKLKFSKILTTRTLANRIRHFEYGSGYTTALNTPVQGSEADIVKLALGKLVSALKPYGDNVKLLASIHDEIILEAKENIADQVAKILSEVMVSSGKEFLKRVPIEAEASIGDNWADK